MKIMIGEPRVVDAGRGAAWWGSGWRLFTSAIWTWIGIMIVYIIISVLINSVPYVGDVGHALLTPVFMGGLMIGCQEIERGGRLRVSHLFEGFQGAHFVPLMIIGAVNIAIVLGIIALAAAGIMGSLKFADMARMGAAGGDPLGAFFGSVRAMTGTGLLLTLLVLVVGAVFGMLNWFAPALVALRGATAVEAMRLSFVSCLRNWVPFLVYGAIAIAVAIAVAVLVGALALAAGVSAFMNGISDSRGWMAIAGIAVLFFAIFAVAALVVGPIVFGSTYGGYKDTLASDDTSLGNPAYH
ncbi:MAG: BPSS1780 family membrane protein [Burkholderiales bacterium]